MTDTDVKPCPFCGSSDSFSERADYSSDYRVCNSCSARGPLVETEGAYEEEDGDSVMEIKTIAAWNRRAALSGTREAVEGWKLVPVEPTDGMIEAGEEEFSERARYGISVYAADIYTAMLAATPPAEAERGAVTDETVRLACPQCDFGIGLHEPGCGQLPAALRPTTSEEGTGE